MRRGALLFCLPVILAGCARDRLVLFPNEGGAETGSVAVLDPAAETERGVLDRPNSSTGLGRSVRARDRSPDSLEKRYGDLLRTLPTPPRTFLFYFDTGDSDINAKSRAQMPVLIEEIRSRPGADLSIVGHTDAAGDDGYNDTLSEERAGRVAAILQAAGVDIGIVHVSGRGERDPLVKSGRENEPDNRRVEVIVR